MAQTQNPEFLETRSVGRLLFEFSLPAITAAFVMAIILTHRVLKNMKNGDPAF